MAWSDENFQQRVIARAAELGLALYRLLNRAGVSQDLFYRTPTSGRRIDTLEKIAGACQWSLAEAMGFSQRIQRDLMLRAIRSSQRVLAALPKYSRDEELQAYLISCLYDELLNCRNDGAEASEEHLKACENFLIRAAATTGISRAPENTTPPNSRRKPT